MNAPLADDYFRLAHEDTTGALRLNQQVTAIGLAGALLGELLISGRIEIQEDIVRVTRMSEQFTDVLEHSVFRRIADDSIKHTVRTWLSVLSQDAYGQVADRLTQAGHVRRAPRRLFWKLSRTYVPVDMSIAAWPASRLAYALRYRTPLVEADVFLAGLGQASGLDEWLIRDAEHRETARRYLEHLLRGLDRQRAQLVAHTHAAVGNALVTHHT